MPSRTRFTLQAAADFIVRASAEAPVTRFAIDVGGAAVGAVGLKLGSDIERYSAEMGYWLGEAYWGQGIMSAAVRAVTEHALGELGMLRVFAVPYVRNPASARVLEHAGFQLEGTMRRSAIKDGVVLDQYLYAKVRE
jgi:RimJ/RimL family protein N-acetyltransferase